MCTDLDEKVISLGSLVPGPIEKVTTCLFRITSEPLIIISIKKAGLQEQWRSDIGIGEH